MARAENGINIGKSAKKSWSVNVEYFLMQISSELIAWKQFFPPTPHSKSDSTFLHSTQLCSTLLHSTQLCSTLLNSTLLNSIQFNSTQINSTQLNSTKFNFVELYRLCIYRLSIGHHKGAISVQPNQPPHHNIDRISACFAHTKNL